MNHLVDDTLQLKITFPLFAPLSGLLSIKLSQTLVTAVAN
jgi:hypothetical protein